MPWAERIGPLPPARRPARTGEDREPWRGRDPIVSAWLDRKDEPGQTRFTWKPLVVTDDLAVVQGGTVYREPPVTYGNLWWPELGDSAHYLCCDTGPASVSSIQGWAATHGVQEVETVVGDGVKGVRGAPRIIKTETRRSRRGV